mmetsp:Transcript_58410/g.115964  ORF Transcript_58410/g.115964 Transcript_58410/m.115964 type:complete len:216 (-) Transcript_58410:244-891(-)
MRPLGASAITSDSSPPRAATRIVRSTLKASKSRSRGSSSRASSCASMPARWCTRFVGHCGCASRTALLEGVPSRSPTSQPWARCQISSAIRACQGCRRLWESLSASRRAARAAGVGCRQSSVCVRVRSRTADSRRCFGGMVPSTRRPSRRHRASRRSVAVAVRWLSFTCKNGRSDGKTARATSIRGRRSTRFVCPKTASSVWISCKMMSRNFLPS